MQQWDLIVVGAGGAGMAAALTAAAEGASVIVIEGSERAGGTYAYSSGLVWIPGNAQARAVGIEDSPELARDHIERLNGDKSVPEVLQSYLANGPETIGFLENHGVPFEVVRGYPDYYSEAVGGLTEGRYLSSPVFDPTESLPQEWRDRVWQSPYYTDVPVSWQEIQEYGGYAKLSQANSTVIADRRRRGVFGWGGATTGYLLSACLRAGVVFRLGCRMTRLSQAVDGVDGIEYRGPREDDTGTLYATQGVILATGGYEHSPALQSQFDPHPPAQALTYTGVDGSGITAAMDVGGSFVNLGGQLMAPVYATGASDVPWQVAAREAAFPGAVVVNRFGKRFADDSFYRALVWAMGAFDTARCIYPNHPAYLITDARFQKEYRMGGADADGRLPGLVSADTLAGLADELGIDAGALEKTVVHYNETADEGIDSDFGRGSLAWSRANGDTTHEPNACVRALTPPYHGIELRLGTMGTYSGLSVDRNGQVLRASREPIPGLYACGNAMANTVEGYWYNSGTSNGRALIFGRVATQSALSG